MICSFLVCYDHVCLLSNVFAKTSFWHNISVSFLYAVSYTFVCLTGPPKSKSCIKSCRKVQAKCVIPALRHVLISFNCMLTSHKEMGERVREEKESLTSTHLSFSAVASTKLWPLVAIYGIHKRIKTFVCFSSFLQLISEAFVYLNLCGPYSHLFFFFSCTLYCLVWLQFTGPCKYMNQLVPSVFPSVLNPRRSFVSTYSCTTFQSMTGP